MTTKLLEKDFIICTFSGKTTIRKEVSCKMQVFYSVFDHKSVKWSLFLSDSISSIHTSFFTFFVSFKKLPSSLAIDS